MAKFINISDIIGKQDKLDICTNTCSPVDVLKWQCQGEFVADYNKGVFLESELHIKKARNFIDHAKESNAGLVLTPEYSFPYKVIEEIVYQKNCWPETGKLWCLAAQGDSYSYFKKKIERWKTVEAVIVEDIAFKELSSIKKFLSPIIYLLQNKDNQLYVIPQFKTGPMHDPWNEFEATGLCEGSNIFVFDLIGDTTSNNRFMSLICSDVLHITPHEIYKTIGEEMNIILFHPQLNPNPRQRKFIDFRCNFINPNKDNRRIITLNWAEGTKESHSKIEFNIPWSALYQRTKYNIKMIESDDNFRELRMKNHRKGLFYTYFKDNRIDIWYSFCKEHCMLFQIAKGDIGNVTSLAAHRYEPIVVLSYEYNTKQDKWIKVQYCLKDSLDFLSGLASVYNNYPLNVCKCNANTCIEDKCVMDKCDFFFGSCFGHFEEGQILCNNDELIDRITIKADNQINSKIQQKTELFKTLVYLLETGLFPDELVEFKDNHHFEIDEERFPNMHLEKHNLCVNNTTNQDMKAIVAITESRVDSEIETLVSYLRKQLHSKYRDQVIVYYPSTDSYKYYNKHLKNTKITDGQFGNKMESITSAF